MAFVHRQSCEGVKSELDLFTVPPTQNCIIASHVVEHQPTASLDSGGPIEFFIPGSGDDYIDLANTMLHVQVKVTQRCRTRRGCTRRTGEQLAAFAV